MEIHKQKDYRMLRSLSPKDSNNLIKHIPTNITQENAHSYKSKSIKNKLCINKSNRRLNQNSSKKYIFNRTTVGTPFQKSTILSFVSTPKEKNYNANYLSFLNTHDKLKERNKVVKNTTISKQQFRVQSTQEENLSQNSIKVNFVISNSKTFSKTFFYTNSYQFIKETFVNHIIPEKIKKSYYGLVEFKTLPFDFYIEQLLKTHSNLEVLIQNNINEITLEPIFVKNKVNYNKMQFKDFQIIRYLGSGGFSSVYLARCLLDGKYCALKFIRKDTLTTSKKIKMLQNEKNILFTITHKNLIDLYYAFETQNYIVFGLEYCPFGNLYHFLQKHQYLNQNLAKCIFYQILSGLQYLHNNNILFRDIKLENILFDINGHIKITDFGLSKPDVDDNQITYSYCGSPQYMAPEMLAKLGHSYQVDYYALGILLYQLLYGKSPFYASKKQDIFSAIINCQPEFPKLPQISRQAKSLIRGLLCKNPKHRIGSLKGIKEISSHPWLRKYEVSIYDFFQTQKQVLRESSPVSKFQSQQQLKIIKEVFEAEKNVIHPQKYFFDHSFVNKELFLEIQSNCIVFKKDKSLQKMVKQICKKKSARFL